MVGIAPAAAHPHIHKLLLVDIPDYHGAVALMVIALGVAGQHGGDVRVPRQGVGNLDAVAGRRIQGGEPLVMPGIADGLDGLQVAAAQLADGDGIAAEDTDQVGVGGVGRPRRIRDEGVQGVDVMRVVGQAELRQRH